MGDYLNATNKIDQINTWWFTLWKVKGDFLDELFQHPLPPEPTVGMCMQVEFKTLPQTVKMKEEESIVMWSITNPNNVTCTFVFLQGMAVAVEGVFVFYTALGAVLFTVMSCVAGAALRSTKSQVTKLFRQQPWTHFTGLGHCGCCNMKWSLITDHWSALCSRLLRLLLWWPQLQPTNRLSKNKRKWQQKMTWPVLLTSDPSFPRCAPSSFRLWTLLWFCVSFRHYYNCN